MDRTITENFPYVHLFHWPYQPPHADHCTVADFIDCK